MYAKQIYVENNGPLKRVHVEFPFTANGVPKPTILVGQNGSGKTNLLSIVADALFEAAAKHYTDVVPGSSSLDRPFFRVVGAITVTLGAPGSVAVVEFQNESRRYLFRERSGNVSAGEVAARLPQDLKPAAAWPDDGEGDKDFSITDDDAREVFERGVYAYFPASRAEAPHWLNRESVPPGGFNLAPRFTKHLEKPIYVEQGLGRFQQWLLSVMLEARVEAAFVLGPTGDPAQLKAVGDVRRSSVAEQVLQLANKVLAVILDDPSARFVWLGRGNANKVGIAVANRLSIPGLEALSGGQATLLSIFGTILHYADNERWHGRLPIEDITGLCIIDEADAHMHIDLQHRALPGLIKLFPKIQFLISSHSPLFALGMEQAFHADGIAIIDMPSGLPVQAEAYAEFGRALEALRETKAFAAAIREVAGTPGKLLVFLEGETDPIYMTTAAQLLGRTALLDSVEFEWVGAKDPKSGQGFHTGKDALNQTLNVLRAKPDFVGRPILLLYDNDTGKPAESHGRLHVRCMPSSPTNAVVEAGIENLLSPSAITDDMFDRTTKKKRGGGETVTTSLNKMRLCRHVCHNRRDPADFAAFGVVLDMVEGVAATVPAPPVALGPSQ